MMEIEKHMTEEESDCAPQSFDNHINACCKYYVTAGSLNMGH